MKRTILPFLMLFLGICAAHAQEPQPQPGSDSIYFSDPLKNPSDTGFVIPQSVVSVNLAGITTDFVDASFFRALGPSNAIGVYGGLVYRPLGAEIVTGSFLGLAYHIHPGGRAPWRFYYGPTLSYQNFRISDASASGVAVGGKLGWQWFPYGHLAAALGLGGYYVFGESGVDNGILRRMYGLRPAVSFDLGYSW